MKKIVCLFILAITGLGIYSCQPDDTIPQEVVTPYATQYPIDLVLMDSFLAEYNMTFDADMEVTFTKIPSPNTNNLKAIKDDPTLTVNNVVEKVGDVNHKLYYITLRQGVREKPCVLDSVYVNYEGQYLSSTATNKLNPFEKSNKPAWFQLSSTIRGWQEIIRLFNSGNYDVNSTNGTITYSDFGAGVMIIPSAFGYYNRPTSSIPAYAPLVFSFKLNRINYIDHDGDRINSIDEDVNGDGFFTNDDTDGDGFQNFLDIDDDGDGKFTKEEIRKPETEINNTFGLSPYYSFNSRLDDPNTIISPAYPLNNEFELNGIPSCSGDKTTPTRVRKHLDKNCQ